MHFHVEESLVGDCARELGGEFSLTYPSQRPAFDTVGGAIDAVMDSAFDHWGPGAEIHVEVALTIEISMNREDARSGAVTGWSEASGEGATWAVRSCGCADGCLAQLFTTGSL